MQEHVKNRKCKVQVGECCVVNNLGVFEGVHCDVLEMGC